MRKVPEIIDINNLSSVLTNLANLTGLSLYSDKGNILITPISDGKDMKDLIKNADKALYKGKNEGKDRTVLYIK